MELPIIGIILSVLSIISLAVLFHFERQRGARFANGLRVPLDRLVEKGRQVLIRVEHGSRNLFRQTLHYFFHKILVGLLSLLERVQARVRRMLRLNRLSARTSYIERTKRNKLDDIADHKAAVALSEEEKRKQKELTLNG